MLNFTPRPNWWWSPASLSSWELHNLTRLRDAIRRGAYADDRCDARVEARWTFFFWLRQQRGLFLGGRDDGAVGQAE